MFSKGKIEILSTKNYSMFKHIHNNRGIKENKIINLIEIIKVTPNFFEVSPIKCNTKYEIWDGQHRIEAAKRLNIPVFYQVVTNVDIDQVRDINNYNAKWDTKDYVHSLVADDNTNYKLFKVFQDTYGLDLSASLMLLTGRFSHTKINSDNFKSGKLVVTHFDDAVSVAGALCQIEPYHKGAKTKHFIVAFNKMRTHRNFDFSFFMVKLEMNSKMLVRASTTEMYAESLCDMYNFKTRKNDRIDPRDLNFKGNNGR